MNLPAYARAAARLLRGTPQPDYFPSAAARARSLSTIERALVTKQRRQRWFWLGATLAAAAGFVLVVVGIASRTVSHPEPAMLNLWVRSQGFGASVTGAHGTLALTDQVPLSAGSSVTTSEGGSAMLRLSTGTRLALGTEGRVSVASVGKLQRFRLTQGALDAKVAKLKPGERFVIDTLDATVEVRGTSFRVTVLEPDHACEGGVRTRVRVSEGVVNVRARAQSIDVRAGASWPANCAVEARTQGTHEVALDHDRPPQLGTAKPPRLGSPSPRAMAAELRSQQRPTARAAASEGASEPEPPQPAALSRQNDEFELAVRARQRGDVQAALGLYQAFVGEFPTSPLAQNARVEVMRLLARSNKTAAANAASDYLSRHPTGFARGEAERLLAAP